MEPTQRNVWLAGLVAFVVPLVIFGLTHCPTVALHPDSAELVTAVLEGGIAHPPGYPTYMFAARAFLALGGANPARALNFMSVVFGALTAWGVFLALRELLQRSAPAVLGALLLAGSGWFWRMATMAEVYTFHSFFLAMQLFFLLRYRRTRSRSSFLIFALFLALGLGNHPTAVLILGGVILLFAVARKGPDPGTAVLGLLIVLVITGSLYAWLPYRQSAASFQNPWLSFHGKDLSRFDDLAWYASGRTFAPLVFGLSAKGAWHHLWDILSGVCGQFDPLASLWSPGALLGAITQFFVLVAVLAGAFFHFKGQRDSFFLCAAPLMLYLAYYAWQVPLPDDATFYLPVQLFFAFWLAVFFKGLVVMTEQEQKFNKFAIPVLALAGLCLLGVMANGSRLGNLRGNREGRILMQETLAKLPDGGVVIADSMNYWLLRYARHVERDRKLKLVPYAIVTRALWASMSSGSPSTRHLAIRDRWTRVVETLMADEKRQIFTTMANLSSLASFPIDPITPHLFALQRPSDPILLETPPAGVSPLDLQVGDHLVLKWAHLDNEKVRPGDVVRLRLGWTRQAGVDPTPLENQVITIFLTDRSGKPVTISRLGAPGLFYRLGHGRPRIPSTPSGYLQDTISLWIPPKGSDIGLTPGPYGIVVRAGPSPGMGAGNKPRSSVATLQVL